MLDATEQSRLTIRPSSRRHCHSRRHLNNAWLLLDFTLDVHFPAVRSGECLCHFLTRTCVENCSQRGRRAAERNGNGAVMTAGHCQDQTEQGNSKDESARSTCSVRPGVARFVQAI